MRIKDAYGVYHDIAVPPDFERQLYQGKQVTYGYIDLFRKGIENEHTLRKLQFRFEKKH